MQNQVTEWAYAGSGMYCKLGVNENVSGVSVLPTWHMKEEKSGFPLTDSVPLLKGKTNLTRSTPETPNAQY